MVRKNKVNTPICIQREALGLRNSNSKLKLETANKLDVLPENVWESLQVTGECGPSSSPLRSAPLRFMGTTCSRQHPLKTKMGAVFADACEVSSTMLGVCDGVSEVQNFGIDPALLPRELLARCKELIESKELSERSSEPNYRTTANSKVWLRDLLEEAYFSTSSKGSTTVLLAAIEEGRHLVTINVGDSELLVLRQNEETENYEIIFKTEPLRYDQNRPYQVGRLKGVRNSQIQYVIHQGQIQRMELKHGDVLVLGSDGLFDNLYDDDIAKCIGEHCGEPDGTSSILDQENVAPSSKQLRECANELVQKALQTVSIGQVGTEGGVEFSASARVTPAGCGGKADDTSCIVATAVHTDAIDWSPSFYHIGIDNDLHGAWLPKFCCTPSRGADSTLYTKRKKSTQECTIL